MLDICDDIAEIKECYALLTFKYVKQAIYGNPTEALFNQMLLMDTYINILECNMPYETSEKIKIPVEGQKVSFSSLRKQNNNLILDTERFTSCFKVEHRPCLSDEEICKIVERAKLMCYNCN